MDHKEVTVSTSMLTRKSPGLALLLLGGILPAASWSLAADVDIPQPHALKPAEVEFFESKIPPATGPALLRLPFG